MPATTHSKLGASAAHRWMNCPGCIKLSETVPEPPTSWFAAEGTVAHAVGEEALRAWKSPEYWIGMWGDQDGDLYDTEEEARKAVGSSGMIFEITDEMVEAVKEYYRYIVVLMKELRKQGHEPELHVEKGFDLSWVRPNMFGTNDACVFVPGEVLYVCDYKHGKGHVVEVKNNSQLLYYALGALRELCWDEKNKEWDADRMPTKIVLVVSQPRARHKDGTTREWEVDPTVVVEDFLAELMEAADRTALPNAELRSGGWCTFCPAMAACPELQERTLDEVGDILDGLTMEDLMGTTEDKAQEKKLKEHSRAKGIEFAKEGGERLGQLMAFFPLIEEYIKAVTNYSQGELEAGREVPGQKLARKGTKRRWIDEEEAAQELELEVPLEDLYQKPKLVSFTVLEKREGLKDLIARLVEKPEGALVIVPESDTRPAVEVKPMEDMDVSAAEEDEDDFV